jgi:hypothetical protein
VILPSLVFPELGVSFSHQVAVWVPDMFSDLQLVKMYSIDKNTVTAKAREKNQHRFGILRIYGGKKLFIFD